MNEAGGADDAQGTIVTHTLTDSASGTLYALKSDEFLLDDYVGSTVTIKGHPVVGYPVDGGPVYLNVFYVTRQPRLSFTCTLRAN